MIPSPLEIEGSWEQIAAQAPQYVRHKIRLTVLPEYVIEESKVEDTRTLEEKMTEIISKVHDNEWAKLPLDMGDNLDSYIYGTPKRS